MVNDLVRWSHGNDKAGRGGLWSGMAEAVGGALMLAALIVGVAVALVFAATVAIVLTLATALLALSALAWRVRPRSAAQRVPVRPVGHAWIVYSLDRR